MAEQQSSSSIVSVTLLDPDVLECPICCEPLKIPIFQCENGHLACSPCCEKVKNLCPSCKSPIMYSRCRAMEKVIATARVSCPNAKYGCKENVLYENSSSHENQCVFSPCSCPVGDCNYTGSHKDLKNHVNVEHKGGLIYFKWDTPLNVSLNHTKKITILTEEKDGELIVIRGFKGSDGMFVSVSCIAPLATDMGRLSCSLKLKIFGNTLKQILILTAIQKTSEEQPKDDFMLIPYYMLRWTYSLEICISRNWLQSFLA